MNQLKIVVLLASIMGLTVVTGCAPTKSNPVVTQMVDNEREQGNDVEEEQKIAKYKSLAKITPEQAQQAAEAAIGGKAKEVELDNEDGNLIYEVEIGNKEVIVDAGNGKVLYITDEDEEDKLIVKPNRPRSSIQVPKDNDDD